jgi:hypothetical protein
VEVPVRGSRWRSLSGELPIVFLSISLSPFPLLFPSPLLVVLDMWKLPIQDKHPNMDNKLEKEMVTCLANLSAAARMAPNRMFDKMVRIFTMY